MAKALLYLMRVRDLSVIVLTLLAINFEANAEEVGLECDRAKPTGPFESGSLERPTLFVKFWIDTANRSALYREESDTEKRRRSLTVTPGAYTLDVTYCNDSRQRECETYEQAIINRSNAKLRFFELYDPYDDVTNLTVREVSGRLECKAIDSDEAKEWIEVSAPKF